MAGRYDPALERYADNMSMVLGARILAMLEDSGASQLEAHKALQVADALIPTLSKMSYVPPTPDAVDPAT